MRIGIDARFYGTKMQGFGRYTSQLIYYLQKIDTENSYIIFTLKDTVVQPLPRNFKIVYTSCRWYTWREQLLWPFILYRHKIDMMHFIHSNVPILYRKHFIVTIHDLILMQYPSAEVSTRHPLYFKIKYLFYRLILYNAIKSSKNIITVSKSTRSAITKYFPKYVRKIRVIYEAGIDLRHCVPASNGIQEFSRLNIDFQKNKYLLYVGNCYPHKNLYFLVDCFSRWLAHHPEYYLILVGKKDFFYNKFQQYVQWNKINHIILTGAINDRELYMLYSHAYVFVFPSLIEGFGIPPLEAMRFGVPVLASNRPSMPEILGDAALYFYPDNHNDFINKLNNICIDVNLRRQYTEKGFIREKKYSWDKMARQTHCLYQ